MRFFLLNSLIMRFRRRKRRKGPHVPSAELVLLIELFLAALALAFALTGRRGEFLDQLHPRADAIVVVLVACLVAAAHSLYVRRILPFLIRRASPVEYDHQRILLELGDAARHSNNLTNVYTFSVNTVAHALEVANVSVLVRDQASGNFLLRSSSATDPALATEALTPAAAPHPACWAGSSAVHPYAAWCRYHPGWPAHVVC